MIVSFVLYNSHINIMHFYRYLCWLITVVAEYGKSTYCVELDDRWGTYLSKG